MLLLQKEVLKGQLRKKLAFHNNMIEFEIALENGKSSKVYANNAILGLVLWYGAICSERRPLPIEPKPFEVHTRKSILDVSDPERVLSICIGECERSCCKLVELEGKTFEEKGTNLLEWISKNGNIIDINFDQ